MERCSGSFPKAIRKAFEISKTLNCSVRIKDIHKRGSVIINIDPDYSEDRIKDLMKSMENF